MATSFSQQEGYRKFLAMKQEQKFNQELEKNDIVLIKEKFDDKLKKMQEKYGLHICVFCKYYLPDKKTCAWNSAIGMSPRGKQLQALKKRIIKEDYVNYCELFKDKYNIE